MLTKSAFEIASMRQNVQYLNAASLTLFLFDYFLMLRREVDLIWKSRWSISKIVFLLSRYPAFVDVPLTVYYTLGVGITHETCWWLNSATTWSMAFGIGMSHVVLLLRTYALWSRSLNILLFLGLLFFLIYIPALVVLGIFLHSAKYGPPPLFTINGCYPIAGSNILIVDFALIVVYETIIITLTLWIFFRRYRHSSNRLVITLYRDGILYFGCIFAISCSYITILLAGPPEYADLFTTFQRVMHSLLAARILLNVRETASGTAHTFTTRDSHIRTIEGAVEGWKSTNVRSVECRSGEISGVTAGELVEALD